MAGALDRRASTLTRRERIAELVVGGLYVVAALALLIAAPPEAAPSVVAAAGCMVALAVALHVEFDIGSGFTVPSQVAFIPLLFALPASLVPVAVPAIWAASKLPQVVRGEVRANRLLLVIGNSWFAIGPAAVLALSGVEPRCGNTAILLVALAAQFACDLRLGAARSPQRRGDASRAGPRGLGLRRRRRARSARPYGRRAVDAWRGARSRCFLSSGCSASSPASAAPRRGLGRAQQRLPRTALLLGDVVEADDSYTGEHCRDVVSLALEVGARLGLDADAAAQPGVRRAAP